MSKKLLFVVNHAEFFVSHRLPIALAARDSGMQVSIATSSTPAVDVLEKEGFLVHRLPLEPGGMNPFKDAKLLWALVKLFRKERPDIIHQVTIKPVMYGSLAARLAKVPAVVNAMSGLGYLYINRGFKAALLRGVLTRLLRLGMCHPNLRFIFQNPDDREAFVKAGIIDLERVRIIKGSGVDPSLYCPREQMLEGPIRVLFPARLLWDKGIGEFIEAVRLLKVKYPEVRFVIVGGADENNPKVVDESVVHGWVQEGLVQWWGMRQDMPEVLAQSHIVCLPSYREGLPKVLIEAASCGLPIVSTDVPGCREIVEHEKNGLLVPAKEYQSLADAIERLILSASLREAMGNRGREMVLQEFTLDRVVEQTLELYEESLKEVNN